MRVFLKRKSSLTSRYKSQKPSEDAFDTCEKADGTISLVRATCTLQRLLLQATTTYQGVHEPPAKKPLVFDVVQRDYDLKNRINY